MASRYARDGTSPTPLHGTSVDPEDDDLSDGRAASLVDEGEDAGVLHPIDGYWYIADPDAFRALTTAAAALQLLLAKAYEPKAWATASKEKPSVNATAAAAKAAALTKANQMLVAQQKKPLDQAFLPTLLHVAANVSELEFTMDATDADLRAATALPPTRTATVGALTLLSCDRISEPAAIAVVTACPNLVAASSAWSDPIGDATMQALAESTGGRLRALNIDNCAKVTDDGLVAVLTASRDLRRLAVGNCGYLTDGALEAAIRYCPRLRHLDVSRCSFTAEAVLGIAVRCTQLRTLVVASCPVAGNIRTLAELRGVRPSLTVLTETT